MLLTSPAPAAVKVPKSPKGHTFHNGVVSALDRFERSEEDTTLGGVASYLRFCDIARAIVVNNSNSVVTRRVTQTYVRQVVSSTNRLAAMSTASPNSHSVNRGHNIRLNMNRYIILRVASLLDNIHLRRSHQCRFCDIVTCSAVKVRAIVVKFQEQWRSQQPHRESSQSVALADFVRHRLDNSNSLTVRKRGTRQVDIGLIRRAICPTNRLAAML